MNQEDILIIGGGIAGLSAGCHAQANGYSSRVLEMHRQAGGLCTAWNRKGYTFDYCIHWLVGSSGKGAFRELWDFLDIAPADSILNHDIFYSRECDDGTTVHWYTDADRLEEHLCSLSRFEEDKTLIRSLTGWIRKMSRFNMMESDFSPKGLIRLVQSMPAIGVMGAVRGQRWDDFAGRFKTPILKEALGAFFEMKGFPLMAAVFTLGFMHAKNAGYPLGASLPMAKRVEARYLSLGGTIEYHKQVSRIIVEDDVAVGVRCVDGGEYRARWVVSAADAHETIYGMLGNRYPSPEWEAAFNTLKPFPGPVQASFGVRLDETSPQGGRSFLGQRLDTAAPTIFLKLKRPLTFEDKTIERVGFHHYACDPGMGPAGGTPVTFLFSGNTSWWRVLAKDKEAYKREKERLLDDLTTAIDGVMPGFAERVVVRDLATPLTNIRYTGNWEGAQEGFLLGSAGVNLPATLPALKNFLLCGQWRHPGGGIPPAALEGRNALRTICKAEGRRFRARNVRRPSDS